MENRKRMIVRHLPVDATLEKIEPILRKYKYSKIHYLSSPGHKNNRARFKTLYVEFASHSDAYEFQTGLDAFRMFNDDGEEYVLIVELAPFQKFPSFDKYLSPECSYEDCKPNRNLGDAYKQFLELKEPKVEDDNSDEKLPAPTDVEETVPLQEKPTLLVESLLQSAQFKKEILSASRTFQNKKGKSKVRVKTFKTSSNPKRKQEKISLNDEDFPSLH
ncbi:hypothetical protein RF11_01121 [Thelohanellus kitauei]|uniref:UPF3 domain-containing protein n=1 Tax=Thelohanellus kitauei TaxID=669202 RepID=A0A0C2MRE4_THEKT|nr:hypothetical protein RF11_01121 [Thelohanellus kitauei]